MRKLEHSEKKKNSSKKVIYREMKICTLKSQSETRWVILVFLICPMLQVNLPVSIRFQGTGTSRTIERDSSVGKESACNAGDLGSIAG